MRELNWLTGSDAITQNRSLEKPAVRSEGEAAFAEVYEATLGHDMKSTGPETSAESLKISAADELLKMWASDDEEGCETDSALSILNSPIAAGSEWEALYSSVRPAALDVPGAGSVASEIGRAHV